MRKKNIVILGALVILFYAINVGFAGEFDYPVPCITEHNAILEWDTK